MGFFVQRIMEPASRETELAKQSYPVLSKTLCEAGAVEDTQPVST